MIQTPIMKGAPGEGLQGIPPPREPRRHGGWHRHRPRLRRGRDGLRRRPHTPLIAAIFGKPDFSTLTFTINGSHFLYGAFINAVLSFVAIAAAVFFFVVKPVNSLRERRSAELPLDVPTHPCPECLSDIPVAAHRCAFCTAEVAAA
jgi:large conductance mechanosensitive channel